MPIRLTVVYALSAATALTPRVWAQPATDGAVRTIVLPDDNSQSTGAGKQPPPATLHIPEALRPEVLALPTSSVTVIVQYPGMEPWSRSPHCRFGWCDGKLQVTVSHNSQGSPAESQIEGYRGIESTNARALAAAPGGVTPMTRQATMPGYDISWAFGSAPGDVVVSRTLHARDAKAGEFAELAECDLAAHSPTCSIMTDLTHDLHLRLQFSADLWPERDAIRSAAIRLARSMIE